MNIVYLANHINIGGISSYILNLAEGLKQRGHKILVASSGGELLTRFREKGIAFVELPLRTKCEISPKIFFSKLRLLKLTGQERIDILHSNSRTTQVLASAVSKKTGIMHISTCHGFFKKRFSRLVFPCWGEMVIAISESVKDHLVRDFRVNPEKIRVVHSGIDLVRFRIEDIENRPDIKMGLGLGGGPVIGIIARLSQEKGHIYLIQAMRQVIDKVPQAQLLIVGEGRMKKALLGLIEKLGLNKSVFLVPSVVDTPHALSVMDLFVLPSLKEGLGLALMEAMAAGLPVIGSSVGGIKSLIRDRDNGLLVKAADADCLAEAIVELLKNYKQANSLAARARIFIKENFSQSKMVLETERVYLQCLGGES